MRADDPAAAVRSFTAALELMAAREPQRTRPNSDACANSDARREITQGLWRARILSGDADEPLAQAQALAERDPTPANQLDYALLLLAAQQKRCGDRAACRSLAHRAGVRRRSRCACSGLIEFQDGQARRGGRRFTELLTTGKFVDDALLLSWG